MANPYDDDLSLFAVTFMRAVIAWNNAEQAARAILRNLSQGGIGVMVTVEHLDARSLEEALLTLCDIFTAPEAKLRMEVAEHIAHFVTGMNILRGYRNFYVHSLRFTGMSSDLESGYHGYLSSIEAKGRYAFVNQTITTQDLEVFVGHTLELEAYGEAISDSMAPPSILSALAGVLKPSASLKKPTWPETLKKPRSYLIER